MPSFRPFLGDDFLLDNDVAAALYHDHAARQPILDYHNHLPPQEIADNRQFETITQIWLAGDHYKWRALRTHGVAEHYVTGGASDWEKFERWAATVPYTVRNPLYHWTHLELRRYFGIQDLLNPASAAEIFAATNAALGTPALRTQGILQTMNVEVVCTTDDPTDDLQAHLQMRNQRNLESGMQCLMLPTFRPDKAILIDNQGFTAYVERVGVVAGVSIRSFADLLDALERRMDFFASLGCRLADHGLERLYAADFTDTEADRIFQKRLHHPSSPLTPNEVEIYQSALLYHLAVAYHRRGWTQQFHLGALRNNNTRLLSQLGPDTGFDSIGDFEQARPLSRFLDRLDRTDQLAQTILYNLNPRDNEVFAAMTGNFNDGSRPGKIQWGSAWWFLDQKDGMEKQLNTLSNLGLLSRFVGMLTDSRSFLSFPRHEYFRRILCNLIGRDVVRGELPPDLELLGNLVEDVCYRNAKAYFGF